MINTDLLNTTQRRYYYSKIEARQKDPDTYAALIWVVGSFGAHRFYLGQTVSGFIHFTLGAFAWIIVVAGFITDNNIAIAIGFIAVLADWVIWFYDLIHQERDLDDHNNNLEKQIFDEAKLQIGDT